MIASDEKRWIWVFGALSALVTTLPYLVGFAAQGQDWRYSGLLIASEDGYSYLAKMLLGSSGDWLFRTPYTAFPQTGFLAFVPYMLLGRLAGGEGRYEQLVALFHWFRISGVLAATWATYQFVALFIVQPGLRKLGTALALFGGGLGFLSLFGLNGLWQGVMKMPLEFYSPETFGFLSLLALPHLAWARALLLWGLIALLRGKRLRSGAMAGLFWLVLGLMQPLTVVSAWAVWAAFLAGWAIWNRRVTRGGWTAWRSAVMQSLVCAALSAPLVLYNFLAFQMDPFLKRWQARNLIPSPPPGDYLLAFGLILPLAIAGAWSWRKQITLPRMLILAWVVIFPLLAYAPYNLQRRLPEGAWVALCVLAAAGLAAASVPWTRLLRVGIGLTFLSSAVLYAGAMMAAAVPAPPLFQPRAEALAMDELARQAENHAVVLASYDISNKLPARAAVRVLIGHGPESLDLEKIQPEVEAFFTPGMSDRERAVLLAEFGVGYIFYGPEERALGGWNPDDARFLEPRYRDGDYAFYRVILIP